MREKCTDCGVFGQPGNSILRYMRYGVAVNLCWDCTATPYTRRQMALAGRKPNHKAERQQKEQKPQHGR